MSIIEEAKRFIKPLNAMGNDSYIRGLVNSLIKELEKQNDVVEEAENIITNSYYGHDEVNLDKQDRDSLKESLSKLNKDSSNEKANKNS
jgi:hypothetical protein